MLHQLCHSNWLHLRILHACYGILYICHTTINHFAQIMRWHICGHTYRNTTRTIHQQVRETTWQHDWLAQRVIKVQLHIYGILLDIAKHLLRQLRETCLCITHSSCTITVHRTKVTLSIYQHITHIPWLCHTHQCTIDTTIAVRVILTHYLTHDTRRFLRWLIAGITQLMHSIQYTTVYWLKTVAHIWQSSCYNHTHRVVDVRTSHFLINLYRNNSVVVNHIIFSYFYSDPLASLSFVALWRQRYYFFFILPNFLCYFLRFCAFFLFFATIPIFYPYALKSQIYYFYAYLPSPYT